MCPPNLHNNLPTPCSLLSKHICPVKISEIKCQVRYLFSSFFSNLSVGEVVLAEVGAAHDEAIVENINFAVLETHNLVPLGRQQPRQPASQLRRLVEGEPAPVLALGGRGGRCVVVEAREEAGGRVPVSGDARAAAPVQQHAHAEAGARGEAGGYSVAQPPLALLHAPVEGGHDDPLPAGGRPGDRA